MAQTTINIRIDEDLKKQFEDFCNKTGLNISTAINIFVKTVVREQQIPFIIATDPFYSKANMRAIDESINQIKKGNVVVKTMDELKEMEDD